MSEKSKNSVGWKKFCYFYFLKKKKVSEDLTHEQFIEKVDTGEIDISGIDEGELVKWLDDWGVYYNGADFDVSVVCEESEYLDGIYFTKVLKMDDKYYSYSYSYDSQWGSSFECSEIHEVQPKTKEVVIYVSVD